MQKLILQLIYSIFIRGFLKLIVGVKFGDSKFLLNEEQFIIVANHNSHLDTMSLMASVPRQLIHKIKPVAAQDHFGKTKLQEKFSNFFINSLLIPRKRDKENPDNDPINKMVRALENGSSLILFPEGTRGEPEKEQPLKPGIGLVLSQRPDIKYVPAYMTGMGKAMPKGDNLIVPTSATLIYGQLAKIKTTEVDGILKQIENDFIELKKKNNAYH
ncbi:lysophospholipid acyltransferase family protein [Ulvibacterium sp.]|uniref:lysophospholipid acyltransferase family protein n=1 Tax=Ulvibacterium sp. TaxID=2665914 RepID=UPI003BADA0CE